MATVLKTKPGRKLYAEHKAQQRAAESRYVLAEFRRPLP